MTLQNFYVQPFALEPVEGKSLGGTSVEANSALEAATIVLGQRLSIAGPQDKLAATVMWVADDFQTKTLEVFTLAPTS